MECIALYEYQKCIGIYMIKNIISGLIYIGQTKQTFIKRFYAHNHDLKNNIHDNKWLQNSFNKYGENAFIFDIVCIASDESILDQLEMFYINEARKTGHCCNISDGGAGAKGVHLSEENIKFLAELNRRLNTGKKASQKTKEKMSLAKKGKPRKPEDMKKMVATKSANILDGKKYKTTKLSSDDVYKIKIDLMNNISWDTLAEQYNISRSNINAIRSNRSWNFVEVEGWNEYCDTHKTNTRARQSRSAMRSND